MGGTVEVAAIVGERELFSTGTRSRRRRKIKVVEMEETMALTVLHQAPTLLHQILTLLLPVTVTLLPHLAMVLPQKLMELLLMGANKRNYIFM